MLQVNDLHIGFGQRTRNHALLVVVLLIYNVLIVLCVWEATTMTGCWSLHRIRTAQACIVLLLTSDGVYYGLGQRVTHGRGRRGWLVTHHHSFQTWLFFRRIWTWRKPLAQGLQRKLVAWRTGCQYLLLHLLSQLWVLAFWWDTCWTAAGLLLLMMIMMLLLLVYRFLRVQQSSVAAIVKLHKRSHMMIVPCNT